jgi:tungstate transport system substrate-binding protein
LLGLCAALATCGRAEPPVLRLATTTSTQDSGLLDALLPVFEQQRGVQVDVIAVGTGQALALGERGDADVVLVHAEALERAFVAAGHGVRRVPVMYNDFVIVGPRDDPAGAAGAQDAAAGLAAIAAAGADFASRGDGSGTFIRERRLWEAADLDPGKHQPWYLSLGQGMGATLTFADERSAYALTDRGTFLAQRDRLSNLEIVFGGNSLVDNPDPALRNVYSVIAVSPERHPDVAAAAAGAFVDWLVLPSTQEAIAAFGFERHSQPLFRPAAEAAQEPPR